MTRFMNVRSTFPFRLLPALGLTLAWAPALAQSPVPPAGARPAPAAAAPAPAPAPTAPVAAPVADDPNAIRVLLSPDVETTLVAQMVGRISQLQTQLGARVSKGRAVVGFDCSEAQARLKMAQAENASAQETLSVKQNLRQLNAAGDTEVTLASAEVDKTNAAIAVSRTQLANCTVVAPFTGSIVKVHVKPFQGVNVGTPLVEMVSDGPLKIRLNVPSRWLRQLKEGTPFHVSINETGREYPAKVTAINARVDSVAQTIELEARMDKAYPELLAGMSGVARFDLKP